MVDYENRITIEDIRIIRDNEILVYATNLMGKPMNQWAVFASRFLGAKYGKFFGLQGKAFAIPTIDKDMHTRLNIGTIKNYVDKFTEQVKLKPNFIFLVTDFCNGLGSWPVKEIAPLFKEASLLDNVHLPERYWKELQNERV